MNVLQIAEQFRKAIQLFANNLSDEQALEVIYVFDDWKENKKYTINEFVSYGVNSVGDPQLYKVIQDHISQSDWTPDKAPSLYVAIGLDDSGYPVWAQPTGAHDAYNIGDIVNYNGTLYKSVINGNIYSPETYPTGWEVYPEDTK